MSSEFPWVSGFNTSPGSPAPVPRPHRWGGPSWARPALVSRAAGELRARPGSLQHETWTMGDVHGKGTPLKKRYPVPIGSPINGWFKFNGTSGLYIYMDSLAILFRLRHENFIWNFSDRPGECLVNDWRPVGECDCEYGRRPIRKKRWGSSTTWCWPSPIRCAMSLIFRHLTKGCWSLLGIPVWFWVSKVQWIGCSLVSYVFLNFQLSLSVSNITWW